MLVPCAPSVHSAEDHPSSHMSKNTTRQKRILSPTSNSSMSHVPSLSRSRQVRTASVVNTHAHVDMPCFVIRQALRPLIPGCHAEDNLLSLAATCIRSWAKLDADSLRYLSTQNFVDMALILTGTGPQYVLKQQTAQALRINKMLYISNDFADLVLAKAIKHRGKVHTMFNDITSDWVSRGSSCALLGCRRGDTRQAVFQEVVALKPVRDLHAGLVEAATERQEWLVCSHDATYQVLFSAIGQVPMQQKQGEFHALSHVSWPVGRCAWLQPSAHGGSCSVSGGHC